MNEPQASIEVVDATGFGVQAGERIAADGAVLVPMFWVAGVTTDENGDEYVTPFTPLMMSAKRALDEAERLNVDWSKLDVLHVLRHCPPHDDAALKWLEKYRERAAAERARETQ